MLKRCFILAACFSASALSIPLHAQEYGAEEANTRFLRAENEQLSDLGTVNFGKLKNHRGPSGVPLGGIGVGNVQLLPDGRFNRIGLNNIETPLTAGAAYGSFFAVFAKTKNGPVARRLVRDNKAQFGLDGFENVYYTGLFPFAKLVYEDASPERFPVQVELSAHSGLVPHNIKDSSLPVIWFEVSLTSKETTEAAIAFSWQNIIGKGLFDPRSLKGLDGQLFDNQRFRKVDGSRIWPQMAPVTSSTRTYKKEGVVGVIQATDTPIIPKKATYQNYVHEVAILAERQSNDELSQLPGYKFSDAATTWNSFRTSGRFPDAQAIKNPDGSAVALKTQLKPGKPRTFRFMLVWHFPELKVDRKGGTPGSYFGNADYGRYFHNFFDSIEAVIDYAKRERERIQTATEEWQLPIRRSSYPEWLQFKLINSAYTIYTNSILNRAGDFSVIEGGMGGLTGTIDQRVVASAFIRKFFPTLDAAELALFEATQHEKKGFIHHFVGHYYVGLADRSGQSPTLRNHMTDNTTAWIIQRAKNYQLSGDKDDLRKALPAVKKALHYLGTQMRKGIPIPGGHTTYDDYPHPPVFSYTAGMYLATLRACVVIGNALNDKALVDGCTDQFKQSQDAMLKLLWNGRFYSHGCNKRGKKCLTDEMFTGQLAGQFISRLNGWGDVVPFETVPAALIAQFKTSLSHTPNYYADKVWKISEQRGLDSRGSRCWPFYLETYTAYPALQAGFVEDGLSISEQLQIVQFQRGFTWTQNLWNPGEVTYMSAPVTWLITDVLAGAAYDAGNKTLTLGPPPIENERVVLPLYYPGFWAELSFDRAEKQAELKITKTFGGYDQMISTLVILPSGRPSEQSNVVEIPEMRVDPGAKMNLTEYWNELFAGRSEQAVLPHADTISYRQVELQSSQ